MLHVGFISSLLCQKRWTDICPVNLDQHSTRSCLHMYCTKTNWYVLVILQMQIWKPFGKHATKLAWKSEIIPLSSINGNLNAVVLVFSTFLGIIYTIQKTCMLLCCEEENMIHLKNIYSLCYQYVECRE